MGMFKDGQLCAASAYKVNKPLGGSSTGVLLYWLWFAVYAGLEWMCSGRMTLNLSSSCLYLLSTGITRVENKARPCGAGTMSSP